MVDNIFKLARAHFLQTVKVFQVLLLNNNYSIELDSFCIHLNGSVYCYVSLTIQLNITHLLTHS